ncbi:MAG TPA: PPE domain-containing protein [Amycolatopsis sp.]|uniref:PPE domain-containing protein n=1 Tax=Amycolatopsis sp. TaxID=37632 RepID=UPI002B46DA8D|nr:PPE domain-containing protein [Amycolatopsis sp.]HKS45699.1 PPE domain-containing protein [Amycolatopsis sp.]
MGAESLPYNRHRKHRYYSQDHLPTAAQRRRERRIRRARAANQREASFGKINWAAYEHRQLYDMVQGADPGTMGAAAHRWAQLALGVDSATAEVHQTVQKLLLSWRGGSAVRAAESASKLTGWAAEASSSMRQVGEGLDTYTTAVVEARNRMPEPVFNAAERHFREGYDVNASGPSAAILADQLLDDHLPTHREAVRAKAEAVRVMEQYESISKGVHDSLPAFEEAPGAVADPSGGAPGRGLPGSDDDRSATVSSGASGAGAGGPGVPGGPGGPGAAAGFGAGSLAGAGSGFGSAGPDGVNGAGRATGGGLSATGFGGAGMVTGGPAGTSGARGASGTSGAGMFPGAGAQRGEDDAEHRNRFTEGSGLDLLDDLPPAYPPVLGE